MDEAMNEALAYLDRKMTNETKEQVESITQETKEQVESITQAVQERAQTLLTAQDLVGQTLPLNFWDPLNLSVNIPEGQIVFYREAELKHGRVAMLAAVGIIGAEKLHPWFVRALTCRQPLLYGRHH